MPCGRQPRRGYAYSLLLPTVREPSRTECSAGLRAFGASLLEDVRAVAEADPKVRAADLMGVVGSDGRARDTA